MGDPKHAKQLSTTFDAGPQGRQSGLQLKENGHDVRGQLAQNAQFKAQMMAQMKGRGGAVQRKEDASDEPWARAVNHIVGTGLQIDNAEDACAVLRFVWPNDTIKAAHCASADAMQLAGEVLSKMVNASKTAAELPRVVALSMVTARWFTNRVISAVLRSGDAAGIVFFSVSAVRGAYRGRLEGLLGAAEGNVYTNKRGLGF